MPSYSFIGRDAQGERVQGVVEALSENEVASIIESQNCTPVKIDIDSISSAGPSFVPRPRLANNSDLLIMYCRQMHALLGSGVPITRAIRGLADASQSLSFRGTLYDVSRSLEAGIELSVAMRAHASVFPSLFVSLIKVGENTGRLEHAFLKLAEHLERERESARRFKQATRYPAFLMIAITLALTVISVWVIPSFESLFAKFDSELPLATRFLIGLAQGVERYGIVVLFLVVVLFFVWLIWSRSDSGRLAWHRLLLRVPVIGNLLKHIALSRFVRSFAMVVKAGMPINEGISISASAAGNAWVEYRVGKMRSAIERGEALYPAAFMTGIFTNLVLQMIAVGEESGRLDDLLEDVAQFYDEEVDYKLKSLAELIEPLLIVAMGAMVLILALGVALPLWDLGSAAMRGG